MPKIVDHALYRKELLSQCLALFAQYGYGSITMRQIAQGLGVSTGTLYHYFPSKESLFEQLVEYLSYQDTAEQQIAQLGTPPTLQERLNVVMEFVAENADYFQQQCFIIQNYFQQPDHKPAIDRAIQEASQRYEQALMDYLDISDPQIAIFILSLIDGLLMRRLFSGERVSFQKQGELLAQVLPATLELPKESP